MDSKIQLGKDPAQYRQELIRIIRERSFREGDFTLASGKKSRFYIDLKNTTLHPHGAFCIGELAVDLIRQKELEVHAVGGLTLGADPIATAVSLAALKNQLLWPAFIVRKEAKSHGTSRYIEGIENLSPGSSVLILEDVATTGGSGLRAAMRVKEAGFQVAAILTVVDREEGAAEEVGKKGIPFYSLVRLSEIRL